MRTAFRSRHDWAHLAAQGSSLLIAVDRGVQFLTRSHRTALSEQTGPVPRVTTISFLGKASYTALVFGSDTPEVTVMSDSFSFRGDHQTPLVLPMGIEPIISRVRGGCVKTYSTKVA